MEAAAKVRVPDVVASALARAGVERGVTVLVALSGGADSVALLRGLVEVRDALGIRIAAAHLNHGIRGAESDHDEAFVRGICAALNVELTVERAHALVPDQANLEERARDARREFLNRAADALGARYIALGHHGDDQAETVLMRAMRGAGITGLGAMRECGPGRIIRPLLGLWREEIREYLGEIGAPYVTDSSNFSTAILRNRVRLELIPMLERDHAPDARVRLVELAAEMRALDDLVRGLAKDELARMIRADGALDVTRFSSLAPGLRVPVLREFAASSLGGLRGLERTHWLAMEKLCAHGPPNGEVHLAGGVRLTRAYAAVRFTPASRGRGEGFSVALAVDEVTEIERAGFAFASAMVARDDARYPADHLRALFDASSAAGRLVARNLRPGDRIRPLGIGGSRKLKDVFIDRKVPRLRRANYPVVTLGDEIVWVPGLARARTALVTTETRRVLEVTARALLSQESRRCA
ncbi:MAG: tRNA lysidine(34) synthetase TilS [Candidatus Binataceae bacterium]